MEAKTAKMIYTTEEALVSDELINQSDDAINKALPYSRAGMVIYNAGFKIAKQKSLNNKWISMQVGNSSSSGTGTAGADGEDGVTPLLRKSNTAIQVSYDNGSNYEDLVPLSEIKGEKGDNGVAGTAGADGEDGVSATHSWDGTVLTITSASGTSSTDLKGDKGDKGTDGKTPVKGTDYFTSDDIDTIVNAVYAKVVDGTEVSY